MLVGFAILLVLGYALNDTGILVPAVMLGVLIPVRRRAHRPGRERRTGTTCRVRRRQSRFQTRDALPPTISAFSAAGMPFIVSSMTLREYGQSLPWCG